MNCKSKTKAAVEIPACWGDKNMKHLQGKAAGIEQSQPRRETLQPGTGLPRRETLWPGTGLPKERNPVAWHRAAQGEKPHGLAHRKYTQGSKNTRW